MKREICCLVYGCEIKIKCFRWSVRSPPLAALKTITFKICQNCENITAEGKEIHTSQWIKRHRPHNGAISDVEKCFFQGAYPEHGFWAWTVPLSWRVQLTTFIGSFEAYSKGFPDDLAYWKCKWESNLNHVNVWLLFQNYRKISLYHSY